LLSNHGYTKHALPHNIMNLNSELDFEVSAFKVKNLNTIFCCVYRFPCGDVEIFVHKLMLLLDIILKESKFCVICGDVNINTLDENKHCNILNDILVSYHMSNCVNEPTSIQGLSASCIDHIYSNLTCSLTSNIIKCTISVYFGLYIQQQINIIEAKQNTFSNRKFLNGTRANKLNDLLALEDWSSAYELNSTESKFEMFNTLLVKYSDHIFIFLLFRPINHQARKSLILMVLQKQLSLIRLRCLKNC
jgi:hypothetical protein